MYTCRTVGGTVGSDGQGCHAPATSGAPSACGVPPQPCSHRSTPAPRPTPTGKAPPLRPAASAAPPPLLYSPALAAHPLLLVVADEVHQGALLPHIPRQLYVVPVLLHAPLGQLISVLDAAVQAGGRQPCRVVRCADETAADAGTEAPHGAPRTQHKRTRQHKAQLSAGASSGAVRQDSPAVQPGSTHVKSRRSTITWSKSDSMFSTGTCSTAPTDGRQARAVKRDVQRRTEPAVAAGSGLHPGWSDDGSRHTQHSTRGTSGPHQTPQTVPHLHDRGTPVAEQDHPLDAPLVQQLEHSAAPGAAGGRRGSAPASG